MKEQKKLVKFLSRETFVIKSVDVEAKTVDAVVSTGKVDRDGDIITPDSFKKRIKTYKDHPVFLSSHYYYDLKSQIGEAQSVKITDSGLEVKFKYYAGEGNDQADWAFLLAQKGIAAFSIGFMGMEYDWIREKNGDVERITGRKYTDVELLEISQVLVPSNRGALQMGRSAVGQEAELMEMAAKAFDAGDLKEFEIKEKEVVVEKKSEICGCKEMPRSVLFKKVGDENKKVCAICQFEVSDADLKAIANFCDQVSGTKHYTEMLFEDRATRSIDTPESLADAVRSAFQK